MKTYLIPGLGFDNRIFDKLELDGIDLTYLNWIEPKGKESIKDYAIRFSDRLEDNSDEIILIGHSLGGIISQEIAATIPIKKIILISSIKSREELPFHFKIIKPLYLYKLFSKEITSKTIKYWGKAHNYESLEERDLVKDMVNNHTNKYLQWALKQLSIWKQPELPSTTKLYQIHGDGDKTFPVKLIEQPDRVIKKAGHFMVYKEAHMVSQFIKDSIKV